MKPEKTPIPHELLEHLLDAGKLKYCFECGICTASCPTAKSRADLVHPNDLLKKRGD